MASDITLKPTIENTNRGMQELQHDELSMMQEPAASDNSLLLQRQAQGVPCPHCGEMNDSEAMFCQSCGKPIRMGTCPNCGAEIDPEADFCEVCHHYIKSDVCSFCGAFLSEHAAYCHECGNPRGGIVCPTCHTLNDFAFCKQCGSPLTEEARSLMQEMKKLPEYQELLSLARDYEELSMQLPFTSERDVLRSQMNEKLRERVLTLLAKDAGVQNPEIPPVTTKRLNKEELQRQKQEKIQRLTDLLDKMAIPQQPSPARVRNYAMACKPRGIRLAWVCNFKHAMHSSPCGCAKPQLGGKWVILGKNSSQEIKDDK